MSEHPNGDTPPSEKRLLTQETKGELVRLARESPETLRDAVGPELLADTFITLGEAVRGEGPWTNRYGQRKPQRWAVNGVLELMRLTKVNAVAQVNILMAQLGVTNEAELRQAVRVYRSADDVSLEEAREEAVAMLRMVLTTHPEWIDGVVERITDVRRRAIDRGAAILAEPPDEGAHP